MMKNKKIKLWKKIKTTVNRQLSSMFTKQTHKQQTEQALSDAQKTIHSLQQEIETLKQQHSKTPISDMIKQHLQTYHINYQYQAASEDSTDDIHHIHITMVKEEYSIGLNGFFRINEETGCVAFYGLFPHNIPKSHQPFIITLITKLNHGMTIGNLEMDLTDGELRCRVSLDTEFTSINDNIISYLIKSTAAITFSLYPLIDAALESDEPDLDLQKLTKQFIHQEDEQEADEFFVASKKLQ